VLHRRGTYRATGHMGRCATVTRRQLALAVYLPTFLLAYGQGIVLPTMPLYALEFNPSIGLASLAVAALAFGTLIADVPSGMILEKLGRRPMMLLGTLLVSLSYLGLAMASSYSELLIFRVIAGVGTAFWGISRLAFMTDVIPIESRGRSLSMFGGIQRIGTFVGPVTGGLVASAIDLRASFFVAAALGLSATVMSFLFVPETRPSTSTTFRRRWGILGGVLRRSWKDLLGAGSAQIFAQAIRSGRQIIVPLYGATVIGLSAAEVGTIISISAVIDMSLFLPAGMLMDRLGRKYATIPSFIVMAIGMALLPFTSSFITLLAATAVMGLGNGLGSGTMMTLGADLAPKEAAGEFLGLWRLVGDTGQMGGPIVVGGVADLIGLAPAALVLAGIGVLAAGTIYVAVEETLKRPATPRRITTG
jgi:MFS family permease